MSVKRIMTERRRSAAKQPALLLALTIISVSAFAVNGGGALATSTPSARAAFTSALARIARSGHVAVDDPVNSYIPFNGSMKLVAVDGYKLQYVEPDRLDVRQNSGEFRRVGDEQCHHPPVPEPQWTCEKVTTPQPNKTIADMLIARLLAGGLGTKKYKRVAAARSAPQGDVRIRVNTQGDYAFSGTLVIGGDGLPRSFTSAVTHKGKVFARQKAKFAYGGDFTITLPTT